jgi:hypothetical protein
MRCTFSRIDQMICDKLRSSNDNEEAVESDQEEPESKDYWIEDPYDAGDLIKPTIWLPAFHKAILRQWTMEGFPSKATIEIIVSADELDNELMDGRHDEMIDELAAESIDGEEGGSIDGMADESMVDQLAAKSIAELAEVRKPAVITYGRRGNRFIGRRNPVTTISNAANRVDRQEKADHSNSETEDDSDHAYPSQEASTGRNPGRQLRSRDFRPNYNLKEIFNYDSE